jgi:Ca2+-binding EF-hand superfamily protein
MKAIGYNSLSSDELTNIIKQADLNNSTTIDFREFLMMMKKFTGMSAQKRGSLGEMVNKTG